MSYWEEPRIVRTHGTLSATRRHGRRTGTWRMGRGRGGGARRGGFLFSRSNKRISRLDLAKPPLIAADALTLMDGNVQYCQPEGNISLYSNFCMSI